MSEVQMPKYADEFVTNVERVLAHVNVNGGGDLCECFPVTLKMAYANELGDGIIAGCGIEIAEGNEPDDGIPSDVQIAAHSVVLMERVREDLDRIIAALEDYTPERADAAIAELRASEK